MVLKLPTLNAVSRLGTAVVVVPLYNPARLAAEIAIADALSNGRLMLGIGRDNIFPCRGARLL